MVGSRARRLLLSSVAGEPDKIDGQSSSERGIEGGSSAKTGASRPWIGYPARARTVKKEILA